MPPKEGDRIRLEHTTDEYTNLSPGDKGTVTGTDRLPKEISPQNRPEMQIHVKWDNGSSLSLVDSQDRYSILSPNNAKN